MLYCNPIFVFVVQLDNTRKCLWHPCATFLRKHSSLSLHVRIIFHFVIHDVPKVFTAVTYREDLTCQVKYRKQVAVETQHCPPS